MSKICCWNCGHYGHFSSKCKEEKKAKGNTSTSNADSKNEGTSAAVSAVVTSSDDEGAWAVEEISSPCYASDWFEEVASVPDVDCGVAVEADWFQEECADVDVDVDVDVDDDAQSFLRKRSSGLNLGSFEPPCDPNFKHPDLSSKNNAGADELMFRGADESTTMSDEMVEVVEELLDTSGEAFVVAESVQSAGRAELYDSGCTNHISPYRDQFKNFQSIPPRHFCAANKQTFSTTGKGELVIDVPNGSGDTQLRLLETLYSAEVGYTLVSIGRLDEAGFTASFGGGKCTLVGEDGVEVGTVPRMSTRVYKVEHEDAIASAAEERLTLDTLHQCMGHISLDAAWKLLRDKMIVGVRLVYSLTKDFFCASCVYAKATRKPAPKMKESERADVFRGEVHSDLWHQ